MSDKSILIRNVPPSAHKQLRVMAAKQECTLNDVLLGLINDAVKPKIEKLVWKSAQVTILEAAKEFASKYWDEPRSISWSKSNPDFGCDFGVVDGSATYCARSENEGINIYRIEGE